MPATSAAPSNRHDELTALVTAFYEKHNPAKLWAVKAIVDEAVALDLSKEYVETSLRDKYRTRTVVDPAKQHVPLTVNADVGFGQDALKQGAGGSSGRARTEQVLWEQVRDWILLVIGPMSAADGAPPQLETLQHAEHPADALRDGVLLNYAVVKLKDPNAAKFPRLRANGMFRYDNVVRFLTEVQALCGLRSASLFEAVDLVDAKNDRSVLTCLLAIGRWALDTGRVAPKVASFDKEIEQQQQQITDQDISAAIENAEVAATSATEVASEDDSPDDDDELRQLHDDVQMDLVLRASPSRDRDQPSSAAASPTHFETVRSPLRAAPASPPTVLAPASPKRSEPPRPPNQPAPCTEQGLSRPSDDPQLASPKRYQARRNDSVDQRVGKAFNKLLARVHKSGQRLHGRIARTRNAGEYVIYHQITGRRTVVYVRELSNALMIRVGGGWEDFEVYLARRLVEYEVLPQGTIEQRDRVARRGNH